MSSMQFLISKRNEIKTIFNSYFENNLFVGVYKSSDDNLFMTSKDLLIDISEEVIISQNRYTLLCSLEKALDFDTQFDTKII